MHITNLKKIDKTRPNMEGADGIYKQIPISSKDGAPIFSCRVFTIEPGLYDPEQGGVRLENDFLCTEKGVEVLTSARIVYLS